jgi:peptide/nickel transport system permease protein
MSRPNARKLNAVLGGGLIAVVLAAALIGLVWTPVDPLGIDFAARLQAPSGQHWLGTDEFGRDVLSRILAGAASSGLISLLTVTLAVIAGTLLGVLAGYGRGATDGALMTVNDALLAFPGLLLALGLLTAIGPGKYGVVFALALAYMPSVLRLVRGAVLSLREREFVEASRAMGNSEVFTVFRHVLPNCLAPLIVHATSMFGWVLLSESALSFLGLGVPPPAPTWGNMLASSRNFISQAPWLGIFPGLCISVSLLGINLLGDALRDRLDPRMRR